MAFNKDFSTYFLTQPEEEDFQVSYTGTEDGFTCSHCSTSYEKDLQLAAELGKTLLERNKELETSLKQHQNVLEDQAQEIEYLTKQTTALREVNDSRLRIYEQLEVSIQDLERNNQRLLFEHSTDKKTIKTQLATIESLENRCDELQQSLNELSVELEKEKRRSHQQNVGDERRTASQHAAPSTRDDEEVSGLLRQIQDMKSQRTRDLRRITDLEENVANVLQENASLEERLAAVSEREQDLKTMQEELSTLEDIRQGHLCRRCLRIADDRSILGEDEDDVSLIESLISEVDHRYILSQLQESLASADSDNPYKILVQKYEELVRAQRKIQAGGNGGSEQPLSLQEELEMSGIGGQSSGPNSGSLGYHDSGPMSLQGSGPMSLQEELEMHSANPKQSVNKKISRDFCESDTSSSGFSDDISNKSTQTEVKYLPGAFLCTISDGDDCRFSIYDDASPVESRFRKTPEYRQLFREIFDVLKRAAEAKDEGEKLPLLDDTLVGDELAACPKVPPVTPAKEDLPLLKLIEDGQSVISEEPTSEYGPSSLDNNLDSLAIEKDSASILSFDTESDVGNTSTLKKSSKRSRSRRKNKSQSRLNTENVENECRDRSVSQSTTTPGAQPVAIMNQDAAATVAGHHAPSTLSSLDEPLIKPKRDILEDLVDGVVKSRKKSKRHTKLLDDRHNTASPPALVGINTVCVNNKLLRRRCRAQSASDSPSRTPDRTTYENLCRYETSNARKYDVESFTNNTASSSAAQEVAKLKILEKSYAEVLKNNSRHHHNQKHRTSFHRKFN